MIRNFEIGNIIWAKIQGYPWWPGTVKKIILIYFQIIEIKNNSEKPYTINFIGDKTHARLSQNYIFDFNLGFEKFSKIKNKKLENAIKEALNLINKTEKSNQFFLIEKKKNENLNQSENIENLKNKKNKNENVEIELIDTEESSVKKNDYLTKKKKRKIEKQNIIKKEKEKELIFKIQKYFIYIYDLIKSKNMQKLEKEKNCLMKILEYLSKYVPENIFTFLNETNICKMILFFSETIDLYDNNFNLKVIEAQQNIQKLFLYELLNQEDKNSFYEDLK